MGARLSGNTGGRFSVGQNAEINVTPFVDVMLVLLIIFMVAAPMATASIKVELPRNEASPTNDRKPVYVDVESHGRVFIGLREVGLTGLNAEVARVLNVPNPTNERIMVRADKAVVYADFMKVMNTLQNGGYSKVGLISEVM
jgi:biopolymer transport protein ExbD